MRVTSDEFSAPSRSCCPYWGSPVQIVQETQHYPQQTNFYSERVINLWNYIYRTTLPVLRVSNSFKRSIVRVDFKLVLQRY